MCPIALTGTPAAAAAPKIASACSPGRGEDQFVIVAAREQSRQEPWIVGENGAARIGQRHASGLHGGRHAGSFTDVAEIGDQSVGDVGAGAGHTDQPTAEREPRLRPAIALHRRRRQTGFERARVLPGQLAEADDAVADGSGDEDGISRPGAAASQLAAGLDRAEGGDGDAERAGRGDRIATDQSRPERRLHLHEAVGEAFEPCTERFLPPGRGQRDRQQVGHRLRAHGGEIGQVDGQRLDADAVRRIVGQEVDVGNQHVGGDDEGSSRKEPQGGGIVGQAEGTRRVRGQRREIAGDEPEFVRRRHGRFRLDGGRERRGSESPAGRGRRSPGSAPYRRRRRARSPGTR